jgi:1,4-alpha-glucan branching enzyme
MQRDPIHRGHHLNELTFGLLYAFTENFVLPFSHDEVVHLKGSMIQKMPGDDWQKFANLRALYGYMYGHPGKQLMFMGSEFGQWSEWNALTSLDWHLLQYAPHQGLQRWVRELNTFYQAHSALWQQDFQPEGFEWIDASDTANVVISFVRHGRNADDLVLVITNLTPVPREGYRIGVPAAGRWVVGLNSDASEFGGSGYPSPNDYEARETPAHGRAQSIDLTIPPLCTLMLVPEARAIVTGAGGPGR